MDFSSDSAIATLTPIVSFGIEKGMKLNGNEAHLQHRNPSLLVR